MKDSLKKIFFLFRLGIVILILALTYWQIIAGSRIANLPENPRLAKQEEKLLRGRILDRNGQIICSTIDGKRQYGGPSSLAPLIGYISGRQGKSGLELFFSRELLGQLPAQRLINFARQLFGKKPEGSDVYLTLDLHVVEAAQRALAGRRGAVVGVDVRTGEILVLATSPAFDPNRIGEDWRRLSQDSSSPLLNRPLQGLYPPGSTFKLITAIGVLNWHLIDLNERFYCPGRIEIQGHTIECFHGKAHGWIDLKEALAVSCNVTFVRLAERLGKERFYETIKNMGLDRKPELGVPVSRTRIPPFRGQGSSSLPQLAIGQGSLLVTPIQMAVLAAAVADGTVRSPYFLRQTQAGDRVLERGHSNWQREVNMAALSVLREDLRYAVAEGTGRAADAPGLSVAGKTGTADNPHGRPHAWFVGFAPSEDPSLALAVVIENAGSGGEAAAPVARAVFQAARDYGYFAGVQD